MQAIIKLVALVYQAWQFARLHPKKSTAAVGAGVASAAMLYGAVSGPPASFHPGNITNLPGSNGQVFESNGDGTYTFGTDDGGVGGGATELSGLDDVANTLTGNSGEFIGWAGTEWDDLTISLDTLSDTTITAAATGEVIRYNGSAWVDSALSVDDLSEVTITSLAAGEILRYNGSALVDTTLSIDDLTEVTITTPADDQFLRYNGSGWVNETVSVSVDATGITDGYVYTADGDATPAWEAPAVGGLLTPDGSTAITRSAEFNVRDYGASGKKRVWHATWATSGGTTTVTTTGNTGVAATHDLVAGNGIVLLGAGAACGVATPSVAAGNTVTPEGTTGATTYQYTFAFHDGNGGYCAPTATIQTTTGNATLTGTNRNLIKGRIPYGATSVTIYGNGTSSRKKLVTLDLATPWRSDSTQSWPSSFVLTNNAGSIRLTTPLSTHGIVTGDYINLKCNTASDTEYDVQALVTNVSSNVIDCSGTAYTDDATGYLRLAQFYYRDCGNAVGYVASKYVPDHENPYARWRAGMAIRRGQVICDTTNDQNFRAAYVTSDRRTGTSEPTWTTNQTTNFSDSQVLWVRDLDDAPVAEPSVARNQALLTTVATTPTASTFTTTVAATADNASHKLALSYNDIFAFRNAIAAAKAFNGGVVRVPAGEYQFWMPKHTNTDCWTSDNTGNVYNWYMLDLSSSTQYVGAPNVSLRLDPGATVRVRMMQNQAIVEDVTTTITVTDNYSCIGVGAHDAAITGGTWEWSQFAGGLTEHEFSSQSYAQRAGWLYDRGASSTNPVPWGLLVADTQVHWPNFGTIASYTASDGFRGRKSVFRNFSLFYGGGDGDLGIAPLGEFEFTGGEIRNVSRLGSHGLYLFINGRHFRIRGTVFGEIYKNAIQIRGSGGDGWSEESIVSDCQFERCGPILAGDITSSNRVHRIALSNLQGGDLQIAECRGLTVTGGKYGYIQLREDNENIKISSLSCDTLDMGSSDTNRDVEADQITVKTLIKLANLSDATIDGIQMLNPWVKSTNLVSGVYKWTAISGLTNIYYCSLLDGTTPGFATPTANSTVVRVRDVDTLYTSTSGNVALDALTDDSSYFGNTEVQTVVHSGTPTGGDFTYTFNGNTTGAITNSTMTPATAATVQTALRLLTGLSACTVTESGSGTDKTFRVCFTGFSGDPPQMTSSVAGQTGGAAATVHATPNAYPGFNTYAVLIGDDSRRDPDSGQYGSVYLGSVAAITNGVLLDSTLTNITANKWNIRSTWNAQFSLVGTSGGATTPTMTNVKFNDCSFDMTGLSSTGSLYLFNMGTTAMPYCDLEFNGGRLSMADYTDVVRGPFQINLALGGHLRLNDVDLTMFGNQGNIQNAIGQVHMKNCRVQKNEYLVTLSASADTATHVYTNLAGDGTTSHKMFMLAYPNTSMPTNFTHGTPIWRKTSAPNAGKLYASEGDANNNLTAIDIAADSTVTMRVADAARLALSSNFEFMGDLNSFNAFGEMEGNTWRDSDSATYATLAADANDYQLIPLLRKHLLSSDASRTLTGIDAPGGGTVKRTAKLVNVGAQDIVLTDNAHEIQTIAMSGTPTSGNYTITFNGSTTANIAYNANSATVQAALRLLPGLGTITVTESGTTPNFTHTIDMNGFNSNPPQMTSTDSTSGGTHAIAHATTTAYTSEWINRVLTPTGSNTTINTKESVEIEYDMIEQAWRILTTTASLDQFDILPLRRVAQWAIEPKRIQLALAA